MRFAAIADVHGNPLALEAVIADIRAQGIDDIVNLGDMASGPLDARRTVVSLSPSLTRRIWIGCGRCRPPPRFGIPSIFATRRRRMTRSIG
jgi:hypothetical protein